MTKEEAIKWFKESPAYHKDHEPFKMAIKALEQESTTKNNLGVDCVARQDVERFIEGFINEYTPEEELEFINIELNGLKHLPSVTPQEPRWIPVSERLPKTDEYVGNVTKYYLVQNEYGDMLVARYTHNEHWEQIYQLKPVADEIVAWMPLPAPYELQESEDKENKDDKGNNVL